jgi:hypothetical protein
MPVKMGIQRPMSMGQESLMSRGRAALDSRLRGNDNAFLPPLIAQLLEARYNRDRWNLPELIGLARMLPSER